MISFGMLWFDNDPRAGLGTKVERAATYYRNKYGRLPTLCFVHPSMIASGGETSEARPPVEVRSTRSVMPNHFWIGLSPTE